jgi:hypothetical protein
VFHGPGHRFFSRHVHLHCSYLDVGIGGGGPGLASHLLSRLDADIGDKNASRAVRCKRDAAGSADSTPWSRCG